MADPVDRILADRLVAVVRTESVVMLPELVAALVAGGISIVEITLTIPGAVDGIAKLHREFGDRILLGAGTVMTAADVPSVVAAGAKFVVSPTLALDVLEAAKQFHVPAIPGAFTPTEIATAMRAGAKIVKLFPADAVGPGYLKAIRGPMPNVKIMPTGGVELESIPAFLAAGACALGVGGKLLDATAIRNRDWLRITALARQYRALVPLAS
jgi:2-dehydro-3-deoxyphosphogluconate aldolase/(4S)-4-hydroxy-2-oxoglutarate aldolase